MTQWDRLLYRAASLSLPVSLNSQPSTLSKWIDLKNWDLHPSLEMRREKLCLKFAKACLKNEKVADMYPINKKDHAMNKRQNEKFVIRKTRTERLQRSAVMHMQRLLNNEDCKNIKIIDHESN